MQGFGAGFAMRGLDPDYDLFRCHRPHVHRLHIFRLAGVLPISCMSRDPPS